MENLRTPLSPSLSPWSPSVWTVCRSSTVKRKAVQTHSLLEGAGGKHLPLVIDTHMHFASLSFLQACFHEAQSPESKGSAHVCACCQVLVPR